MTVEESNREVMERLEAEGVHFRRDFDYGIYIEPEVLYRLPEGAVWDTQDVVGKNRLIENSESTIIEALPDHEVYDSFSISGLVNEAEFVREIVMNAYELGFTKGIKSTNDNELASKINEAENRAVLAEAELERIRQQVARIIDRNG